MTKVQLSKMTAIELTTHFGGTSKAIRGLDKAGFDRGAIAKMLGKRYQHVRNVLITPLTGGKQVEVQKDTSEEESLAPSIVVGE